MRIGLVCPYNYFRSGGVQECVREIAKELEQRGHYVRVLAPRPRHIPDKVDERVILVGASTELKALATKTDVGLSVSNEKIDQILADEQFDVLHFHEPGAPLLGVQVMARSNAAHVGTLHANIPPGMMGKSYQRLMQPVAKYVEARIHEITAVSPVAEATGRLYLPESKVAIQVIPNGIRLADFMPKEDVVEKKSGKKTIVYIGRLEKRKGVKYLVKAYAQLRKEHKDVKLVIAGKGDLQPTLEAYVAKHEIPDVTFKGFVTDKEKVKLLQSATVYCSPAMYGESFGIVLLEAMAAGCVTVAGNNPGYASVMIGRGRLSLVSPDATTDFAQRLELLLYDEEIRTLWKQWAKDYISQFDYEKVVDQYLQAYKRAMAKNKRLSKKAAA